jgi:hypothetical protein
VKYVILIVCYRFCVWVQPLRFSSLQAIDLAELRHISSHCCKKAIFLFALTLKAFCNGHQDANPLTHFATSAVPTRIR